MHKHTKQYFGALSFLTILLCGWLDGWQFAIVQSAFAQVTTPTANMFTETANFAVLIAEAMEMLAFMVFHFLQFFLDPLFIMGFTETAPLREIWRYSRDIMNVIFAFMLIGAGIFTVVNYEAGKALLNDKFKKFILAVILVNFSWFFPRVIFDVANVLTATVYQLPSGLPSAGGKVKCEKSPAIPAGAPGGPKAAEACTVYEDIKYFNDCNPVPAGYIKKGVICYKTAPWDEETNTAYGMLNGLVANYGKLGDLTRVLNPSKGPAPASSATEAERFVQYLFFLMHILFVLVLMAMLFLPLAAMFIVFLIRIPIIWVTIAFMPFMFLGYVADDKLTPGFNTFDIFKHFVKAAFLPVAVAVPFTIGFILISAVTQVPCNTIIPAGSPAADLCNTTGPFIVGVNTLWSLLMLFVTFIIIWVGFWAALKIDDIYVQVTNGIKGFGQSVGKTALKLPLSVPIIPNGKGQNMSILGVDDKIRSINAKLSGGQSAKQAFGGDSTGGPEKAMRDTINDPKSTTNSHLQNILTKLNTDNGGRAVSQINIENRIREAYRNDEAGIKKAAGKDITEDQFLKGVLGTTEGKLKTALDNAKNGTTP